MEPDLAGFTAAQDELREKLGVDATFTIEAAKAYPPGTPLDRKGIPLDPRVDPIAGAADTEVVVRVSTVFRGAFGGGIATSQLEAIGWQEESTLMLDLAAADWETVKAAARVEVLGELYDVRESVTEGFGAAPDRIRVFVQAST